MKRVLVVDDETMNRDVIGKILSKEGLFVLEATNGKEALDMLEQYDIDLILMDLMMPVMDGFEAITAIRKKDCYDMPIIAITALHDNETHQKALQLGADDCITKPFELSLLVNSVKSALKRVK